MDAEIKDYVDARTEATRAQNDAQFAKIMAKLDQVPTRWEQMKWVIGSTITIVTVIVAVLAFGGDSFQSGAAAMKSIFESSDEARRTGEANAEDIAAIKDVLENMQNSLEEIAGNIARDGEAPEER